MSSPRTGLERYVAPAPTVSPDHGRHPQPISPSVTGAREPFTLSLIVTTCPQDPAGFSSSRASPPKSTANMTLLDPAPTSHGPLSSAWPLTHSTPSRTGIQAPSLSSQACRLPWAFPQPGCPPQHVCMPLRIPLVMMESVHLALNTPLRSF